MVVASRLAAEKIISKLFVKVDGVTIKIEVTPVLRGCVYAPGDEIGLALRRSAVRLPGASYAFSRRMRAPGTSGAPSCAEANRRAEAFQPEEQARQVREAALRRAEVPDCKRCGRKDVVAATRDDAAPSFNWCDCKHAGLASEKHGSRYPVNLIE